MSGFALRRSAAALVATSNSAAALQLAARVALLFVRLHWATLLCEHCEHSNA